MCPGSNRGARGASRENLVLRSLRTLRFVFCLTPAVASAQTPLTFNKDIAPIIWTRCAPCHRPGEVGPFSLLTYDDVRRRATLIGAVTAKGLMPPWKPEKGMAAFQDERRLQPGELEKIQQWIAGGAPQGDARDLAPPPAWESGWRLGTPDLVVSM